jgi:cytochrome-b5 reductase
MAARVARFARPAMGLAAVAAIPAVAIWMGSRTASSAPSAAVEALANTAPKAALDPNEFRGFKLVAVEQLTHDTAKYTFELPHENDELGLTVASCLVIKGEADGE